MPLTLIGTLDENGKTSYGAYSLIFPYYNECDKRYIDELLSIGYLKKKTRK